METPKISEPCYTCRRRHIQCDQSQVPCLKCQKAGLSCLDKRPLRWVKGVAIRGSMRGRSYQDPKAHSKPLEKVEMPSISPLDSSGATDEMTVVENVKGFDPSIRWPIGAILSPKDISISNLDPVSQYYLDYYQNCICQLFIVYDSEKNPLRRLVPLALSDSVLLDATLAVAAQHKANADHPFSSRGEAILPGSLDTRDALRFKHRAIQGVSRALNAQSPHEKDTLVASIFLLVFLELLESGCDRWKYHLEGAKNLMFLMEPIDPGRTVQAIRQFIIKQIHLIETFGATFVRPHLLSHLNSLEEIANLQGDIVEQSFLGCPGYLSNTVQFFSRQRDLLVNGNFSAQFPLSNEKQKVILVLDSVKDFDCSAWAASLPREQSVSRDTSSLCALSRAYQLAALLYGQRVLDAYTNNATCQGPLVCELIDTIGRVNEQGALLKCILWPIFIAGLECEPVQRALITHILERFWLDTKCLNGINAAKILQAYWDETERRDGPPIRWIFYSGSLSHDWLLV